MIKSYRYEFDLVDKVTAPVKKIAGAFGMANFKLQSFGKGIASKGKQLGGFASGILNVKNLLLGGFVTSGITRIGGELTNTLATFEKFEAVLKNTLGSEGAAKRVLGDITDFASKTPFQMDALTASWVKLANQGFRPNMNQMRSLGDLASSTGKDIDQLSEAVIDAQVGEFERLKEFGIRAKKSGDQVVFSFKGQQKTVKFTETAIQDYILSLGQMEGVQGSMAAIMGTTGGKLSNLKDKVTQLTLTFAEALKPQIHGIIDAASGFLDYLTSLAGWIQQNIDKIIGWAKVLGLVVGGFVGIWVAAQTIAVISGMVTTIAASFKLLTGWINIAKIAQIAFNFVAGMSPFGWIAIAVGGAIALLSQFDVVKKFMFDLGVWMWKNHPFRWMIELVDKIFPGFKVSVIGLFNKIKEAIGKAFKWLSDNIFKPFKSVLERLFGFKISGKVDVSTPGPQSEGDDVNPYGALGSPSNGPSVPNATKGNKSKSVIDGQVNGVRSGNIKHININFQNLNEGGINITTNVLQESESQIKAMFDRLLLSIVNDVNYQ